MKEEERNSVYLYLHLVVGDMTSHGSIEEVFLNSEKLLKKE